MKKITSQCFTVPVVEVEGNSIDVTKYCSTTGVSFYNGEANAPAQRVANNKPPLLKSSTGRKQALPKKFNDSVLHSWKKEKSDSCDDSKSCLADNDEYARNVHGNKKLKQNELSASSDDIYLVKKQRNDSQPVFRLKNIILEPYSSSGSSVMYINEGVSCVSPVVESGGRMNGFARSKDPVREKVIEKKADFYEPGDIVTGDIVWAKCRKKIPAWPAIVIDPIWQAPEAVLRACVLRVLFV